jgi:hypothetical protein
MTARYKIAPEFAARLRKKRRHKCRAAAAFSSRIGTPVADVPRWPRRQTSVREPKGQGTATRVAVGNSSCCPIAGIVALANDRCDKSCTQSRSRRSSDLAPRLQGGGSECPVRLC